MKLRLLTVTALFLTLALPPATAEVATIVSSKDNTLYEDADGGLSNGEGDHMFVGQTDKNFSRRAVVAFDLSAIPAGSTIQAVTLRLQMTKTEAGGQPASLHRLLADWGEGQSDARGQEGKGVRSAPGDATWKHTFYDTDEWATLGGDFVSGASATISVSGLGSYAWSSAELSADVQLWLEDAGTNFGWIVMGNESATKTAKRFETRETDIISQRPTLIVDFDPPSGVGACCVPDSPCLTLTEGECVALSGDFKGVGSQCETNPCPAAVGACCLPDGSCETLTAEACSVAGGVYQGDGEPCSDDLCPVVLTPFVDALPVLSPYQPVTGTSGGAASYEVTMNEVQQKLHRDLPETTVWAYGTSSPGPQIEAAVGEPVTVKWINNLRDSQGELRTSHYLPVDTCLHGPDMEGDSPRTVVHLHGGKVSSENDGYPEDTFLPGESATTFYPNNQPPGTIWFHDHALGITRLNVIMGLAGVYFIRDDVEKALDIPSGENEIALVIQDRKFNPDGSFDYPEEWQEAFFGDTLMVNGKVWPYLIVRQGKYRFRVVNGSTARTYTLALSTGATFHQIGTDDAMLPAPVPLTELTLMPGERADLVMDFGSEEAGSEILLGNSAPAPYPGTPGVGVVPNVMKFIVTNIVGHVSPLPETLRPLEQLSETNSVIEREFILRKDTDDCADSKWLINGLLWDDITEFPVQGTTEVWSYINRSGISHPMHMHLVFFQILDRQAFTVVDDEIVPSGPRVPPAANERGWKDTVRVDPFEITRVIARFDGAPGLYAYHCHIIEHEDHEMMRQFQLVLPPEFTEINQAGGDVTLGFTTVPDALHAIERTHDLISPDWTVVTNNITGTGGTVGVTDAGGGTESQGFYRVRLTP